MSLNTVAIDASWLAYRCGGSAGFESLILGIRTGFPFHSLPGTAVGHLTTSRKMLAAGPRIGNRGHRATVTRNIR